MREIDVFKDVVRNMVEGTMFHNQMIQFFEYLGLNGFAELQKIRFKSENDELVEIVKYIVEVYGLVIGDIKPDNRNYIPDEWNESARESVRKEDRSEYVRFGIETWKDWEDKSKSLYCQCFFALNDLRDAGGSDRIMTIVKETEKELRFAYNLMCKLRNSDYNMVAVTWVDENVVKLYKKYFKKGDK